MLESLSSATSDLPHVKGAPRHRGADIEMFGRNTAAAIREGVQNAIAGAVERALQALQSNAYAPVVVLTGGGASRILDALNDAPLHRPNLVLQGLAHMPGKRTMKNLLMLLVLANVLYYLWSNYTVDAPEPGVAIVSESDIGPPLNVARHTANGKPANAGVLGQPGEAAGAGRRRRAIVCHGGPVYRGSRRRYGSA